MSTLITRRAAVLGTLAAAAPLLFGLPAAAANGAKAKLAALEKANGGRLGVSILNTATGHRVDHRGHERFPLCSTFKFLAATLVLKRVDQGKEHLDRIVPFSKQDLVTYSPETEKHAGLNDMTLAAICKAGLTLSDNTAGNLMLKSFGGPAALTAFARSLHDPVTRLDRYETELNDIAPGDPRDTTAPAAIVDDMRLILAGRILSAASRKQLITWMRANQTGGKRLRAGLPPDWAVGDKTGTGNRGEMGDIAVAKPPGRAPVIIAAYYAGSTAPDDQRNAVFAEVGRIAAQI